MPTDGRCFLCNPSEDLVYAQSEDAVALCGLGPLRPGYTVVASRHHSASAADLSVTNPGFTQFAEHIRGFLTSDYGTCLLTEHGRMAACVGASGQADPHCFHAHFLLFPAAPPILEAARTHFREERVGDGLVSALALASGTEEYMLISPTRDSGSILLRPGKMIPQFARMLVAGALGRPHLANWKANPLREVAVETAALLRDRFEAPKA